MSYCAWAAVALLLLALAAPALAAAPPSISVHVPASFPLSAAAQARDTAAAGVSLNGSIGIVRANQALVLFVPAAGRSGTQLLELEDPQAGISFRNDTLLLPAGNASLIVATDNMTANANGYSGLITGLELDLPALGCNGVEASASLFLRDLAPGAAYSLGFVEDDAITGAVARDLAANNTSPAGAPAIVALGPPPGGSAVSFAIVSLQAGRAGPYGEGNVTLYQWQDGQLSRPQCHVLQAANGTIYQIVLASDARLVLAAAAPPAQGARPGPYAGAAFADALPFAGLLAVLILALLLVARRAARR